jgi:hypothetical protein
MDSQESSRFTAALTQRVAEDADARQIASAIGAMWADVESALQPVLGRRGVAALFKRTLHLTATRYPWLAALKPGGADTAVDLAELTELLARQSPAAVAEVGGGLFALFRELLTTLIGDRLSERLLQAAWSTSSRAPPAQDPMP